jgi:hypothetical protein
MHLNYHNPIAYCLNIQRPFFRRGRNSLITAFLSHVTHPLGLWPILTISMACIKNFGGEGHFFSSSEAKHHVFYCPPIYYADYILALFLSTPWGTRGYGRADVDICRAQNIPGIEDVGFLIRQLPDSGRRPTKTGRTCRSAPTKAVLSRGRGGSGGCRAPHRLRYIYMWG